MMSDVDLGNIVSILNNSFPQGKNNLENAGKILETHKNRRVELKKEV